jgi:hypothetical protein
MTKIGRHAHWCMVCNGYRGRELTTGVPSGGGGQGDPHHGIGGQRGNVVWLGINREEW